jgi:hypothetical protein
MKTHWLFEVRDGSGTLVAKFYVESDTENEMIDHESFEAASRFGVPGHSWTFPRRRIEGRWVDGLAIERGLRIGGHEVFLIEKSPKPDAN